ncbi:MAG TPA: EAL domain-containing protein [Herbaspirillum sp.]|jgi:diguanylate cyclase (GGDEF)-like protein/PAS domain S-box-containing protein
MITMLQPNDVAICSALFDMIWSLEGPALHASLGSIVCRMLRVPDGCFCLEAPDHGGLVEAIAYDGVIHGYFLLPSMTDDDDQIDRARLSEFAALTGRLLHTRNETGLRARELNQIERKLEEQAQILHQMHESVITMDLAGFIISWNQGAEELFGYTSMEAVGRNVLFLYENEEGDDFQLNDLFMQPGGREMEVRRKKKSGEVFWASLSLSIMRDAEENPVGLIGYITDITERKNTEKLIHHLAYYDDLTKLPNRTMLTRTIDHALSEAGHGGVYGALLFIDLNRFKPINDTLGHLIGDKVLVEVARRLRKALPEKDVVARLGADEFAVALFDIDKDYHAGFAAQKLIGLFDEPFFIDGHALRLGASIGISLYPQDATDTETLLRLSDIAMYRAKRGGENDGGGYAYYRADMSDNTLELLRIETGLVRALEHNELLLYYQPKIEVQHGKISGAEALVRWQHPERGLLLPGEFIPIAEKTGLIAQLGEWVLERACAQAQSWQDAGLAPVRISINVTAVEFTRSLPERIAAALKRHKLSGAWLELEITEGMLMHSTDKLITIMEKICRLGVTISLDDFGTGYSSLSYLKRFPIDTLKIDRSFTVGIPDDSNDCAIASAIISIGNQLKHKVIAEGVENREQLAFLTEAGCNEMQGWLFSPAIPPDEFEHMLLIEKRFEI